MRHRLRGPGRGRKHVDDLRADVDEDDASALDDAVPHVARGLRPHLLRLQPASDGRTVILDAVKMQKSITINSRASEGLKSN